MSKAVTPRACALGVLLTLLCSAALAPRARADETRDLPPAGPGSEAIDTTRLDVERLPPEPAAHVGITRDMYERGLFLEAQLGGVTYVGDARASSHAGPRLAIALGYELTHWFALVGLIEGSQHQTRNRPPPSHTSYELLGGALGARFAVPFNARAALWAAGLVGVAWSSADVLRALDFREAHKLGLSYGGELGFDYHLPARHHSLGLVAGARSLPSLARDGFTLATYGGGYLRYVF